MTSAYDDSYHKIARVEDLHIGKPDVFRAAGATIVLHRTEEGVTAVDGSGVSSVKSWDQLKSRSPLPTRVDDGYVWVCIEACAK
jgi:hypothetical protein